MAPFPSISSVVRILSSDTIWPPHPLQHCSAPQFNHCNVYVDKATRPSISNVIRILSSDTIWPPHPLHVCSALDFNPCIATCISCPTADSFVSEPMWVLPCRVAVCCRPMVLQCSYLCWFLVPICVQLYNPSAVTAVNGIRMNDNLPFALLFCDYKGFTNG